MENRNNEIHEVVPAFTQSGLTVNIQPLKAIGRGHPRFRCRVLHDGQQIDDFQGTRKDVGSRLMQIVAERLFMSQGGPLGGLAGMFGGLGG